MSADYFEKKYTPEQLAEARAATAARNKAAKERAASLMDKAVARVPKTAVAAPDNPAEIEKRWNAMVGRLRKTANNITNNLYTFQWSLGQEVDNMKTKPHFWGSHSVLELAKELDLSDSSVHNAHRFFTIFSEEELKWLKDNNVPWRKVLAILPVTSKAQRQKLLADIQAGLSFAELQKRLKKLALAASSSGSGGGKGSNKTAQIFGKVGTQLQRFCEESLSEFEDYLGIHRKMSEDEQTDKSKANLVTAVEWAKKARDKLDAFINKNKL